MAVLRDANVALLGVAVAVDTVALVLMTFRWRLLLHSLGSSASLWDALLAYSAGVCVSNITPARTIGGDATRAALIRRPRGVPPVKAIAASVVIDRMTDLPGIVMLGLLAAPTMKPTWPRWTILSVCTLVLAAAAPFLYRRLRKRISQWHPALSGHAIGASVVAAVGCSFVIWSLDIVRLLLVGRAFGVTFHPGQAAAMSLLRLGSGLAPVPAGIGVVDGALVGGFIWLGLPASTAAALAIVERAIVSGWATALGAVALTLRGGSAALRKAWSRGASEARPDQES